jgi:two-component system, NarL family, response regulator DevR
MPERRTPIRIAYVDDHEAVRLGVESIAKTTVDIDVTVSVATVDELLTQLDQVDVVLLDLRLGDGSTVTGNVERLVAGGARVIAFTAADRPTELREAARAGVLGVVRKTAPTAALLEAIRAAARDEVVATADWAAALDSDPALASVRLSAKERHVLALYASGEKLVAVANQSGLSTHTVAEYVRRIRTKYAAAGRPAHTKVDLYRRAVEDGIVRS